MISTTGYRHRLTQFIYVLQVATVGQFVMKARRTARLRFPPYKVAAPASPFFPLRQRNGFCKTSHLHAYKVPASASPFLTAEGDETRSKKRHILMSVVTFSTNSF